MTNQDYEKAKAECWKEFIGNDGFPTETMRQCFNYAFDRTFALGKQEKDAEETVISGWVARDADENLFMYQTKPERDETLQMWMGGCVNFNLRNYLFPDITWDDDPIEVEIVIKRKKNG